MEICGMPKQDGYKFHTNNQNYACSPTDFSLIMINEWVDCDYMWPLKRAILQYVTLTHETK